MVATVHQTRSICEGHDYRIYSNKHRPQTSAAFPMRRLFEEFRIIIKPLQNNSKTALEISCHQKRCSAVHSDYISPLAY